MCAEVIFRPLPSVDRHQWTLKDENDKNTPIIWTFSPIAPPKTDQKIFWNFFRKVGVMTGICCEETFFPTCTVVAAQPFEKYHSSCWL